MDAIVLLAHLRAKGVSVVSRGDAIWYRPAEKVGDDEKAELGRLKTVILELLQDDLEGRLAAMRRMARGNRLPLLITNPEATRRNGTCWSCGACLAASDAGYCRACLRAALVVLITECPSQMNK